MPAPFLALSVPYDRLPRGRHGLDPEFVRENQASRAKRALLEEIAAFGYDETTVADVCRRGGVSRESFYTCFLDKARCFEAALADVRTALVELVLSAGPAPSPLAALGQAIDAFGLAAAADPAGVRCLLEEVPPHLEPAVRERDLLVEAMVTHLCGILGTEDRLGCRMLLTGIATVSCPWRSQPQDGTTEDVLAAAAALWPRAAWA